MHSIRHKVYVQGLRDACLPDHRRQMHIRRCLLDERKPPDHIVAACPYWERRAHVRWDDRPRRLPGLMLPDAEGCVLGARSPHIALLS